MIYIKKEKLEEIIKHQNEIIENLQTKIDKAIEYILDGRYGEDDDYESISLYMPKLLEILKGSDK